MTEKSTPEVVASGVEALIDRLRDEGVLPLEAEEQWRTIPWHDTLGAAMLQADEQQRPVLLWAMNGHPLGCT